MNRRELLTGAALLAGIGQANAFGIGRLGAGLGRGGLLGGAGIPAPPSGYGYLYKTDSSGSNQVITITKGGLTYPLVARIRQ